MHCPMAFLLLTGIALTPAAQAGEAPVKSKPGMFGDNMVVRRDGPAPTRNNLTGIESRRSGIRC